MAGDRKGVGIRLFVEGGEIVKRAFDGVADSGKKMWAQIALGEKSANPAVVALSRTSQEAQKGVGLLGAKVGGAANVLGAFGVAGVGVAAAMGAMLLAVNKAREAMDFADQLKDQADTLGISTDALQEYQYALRVTGGDAQKAGSAISSFREKFGLARAEFSTRALKPFEALGMGPEDLKQFDSVEDALAAIIDRIAAVADESEQAAIAEKLGLSDMLPLIREGEGGFQRLADEAHKLGVVMDADLIERAASAKDEFDTMSQVIDIQLKSAFIDLGPVLVEIMGKVANLATALSDLVDQWRELDDRSTRGVKRQLDKLEGERARLILRGWGGKAGLDPDQSLGSGLLAAGAEAGGRDDVDRHNQLIIALFDGRIAALRSELGSREPATPATPAPRDGSGLRPVGRATGGGGAKPKEGPSPEEIAAMRAQIDLEQRLAVARLAGNEATVQAIEDEKFFADQRDKYQSQKAAFSRAEAEDQAWRDLMDRRFARDAEAFREQAQKTGDGFQTSAARMDPVLETIAASREWDQEQLEGWARSVGDATAQGLDAAVRGDFWEYFKQQLYQAALQGLSDAVTKALSGETGASLFSAFSRFMGGGSGAPGGNNAAPGGGGGGWGSAALSAVMSLFGGGRAAGGGMDDGMWYRAGEHGRTELAMVGAGGYVADADATQRMLRDAVGGAGGGGRGGPRQVHVSLPALNVQVPAGFVGEAQLRGLIGSAMHEAVASAVALAGDAAPGQSARFRQDKG